jgi:alpha-methylacyl-CoA racemase
MKPGHDLNYLASSGALASATRPGQAPGIPLNLLGDLAGGGLMAAYAILTAVVGRQSSGVGAHLDVNMVGSILSMLETPRSWVLAGGPDPSWGQGLLSGGCPFYDAYEAQDGRWITVAALEEKFFAGLCEVLDLHDLAGAYGDTALWPELRTRMAERIGERPAAGWIDAFEASDVESCVAPVLSLEEVFERLGIEGEQVPPFRSSGEPTESAERFSRVPGEHGAEILAGIGVELAEAERLYAAGAVGRPVRPAEAVR